MTIFHALILGIVEGVTEFLPISSTAHLIVSAKILGLIQSDFLKSFEIAIQLGAILAVVIVYAKRLGRNIELWKRVIVAFIPTGLIGFVLYKLIKNLLGNIHVVVWVLLLGGIVIVLFELLRKDKVEDVPLENISYKQAIIIGTAQSLAVIPGVSRSAATIISGLSLGLSRKTIVDFSFLLAIPTMLAATGYDLLKNGSAFSLGEFHLLGIGFIASFFVALLSIFFLLSFIKKHSFMWFGVYRIIISIIILTFLV